MNYKEELDACRVKMDAINQALLTQFEARMTLSDEIARIKCDGNIGLVDAGREQAILNTTVSQVDESLKSDAIILMTTLMALSKRRQHNLLLPSGTALLPPPRTPSAENFTVGFQGVPGAWSEEGAATLYPNHPTKNYEYFEDVFNAVKAGEVTYGIVPIENSLTGAIGEVYDLLRRHGCYIVGQVSVDIKHCLMGKPGTTLESVREVLSHPEGFQQCHQFLKGRAWDTVACRNTAVGAEMVAARDDNRAASIGSRRSAEHNGLVILAPDIMDSTNNQTRFIAIASEPEYDRHANTISVTFSTAHKSGALCDVLQAFMAAGINLSRIESRPAGGKYRFFADLQANILDDNIESALGFAAALSEYFEVLGCYPQ